MTSSIIYGPVPSRRLGRSLGINNIPPKRCSYSCVYCQIGSTTHMQNERRVFHKPAEIVSLVKNKVKSLRERNESIDYLTFVPDGEPTLDINLGEEIESLRALGIKIAIITNGSLVWHEDVQHDLKKADWLSLKIDTVSPQLWHSINRPHKLMKLDIILQGMADFARTFKGELTTETMLINGVNDSPAEISKIADFLAELKPAKSYITIPTRPPAERIEPPDEPTLNAAYQIFNKRLHNVEYLVGYEGNAFASTGNAVEDLLSITAVHPMREEAVTELLNRLDTGWDVIEKLIINGKLIEMEYRGKKFYARRLN